MLDADNLRMMRLRLRYSQARFGAMVGQDQAYISKLERGEIRDITVGMLEKLADALGVSCDVLLGRCPRRLSAVSRRIDGR